VARQCKCKCQVHSHRMLCVCVCACVRARVREREREQERERERDRDNAYWQRGYWRQVLQTVVSLSHNSVLGRQSQGPAPIWAVRECLRPLVRLTVNCDNRFPPPSRASCCVSSRSMSLSLAPGACRVHVVCMSCACHVHVVSVAPSMCMFVYLSICTKVRRQSLIREPDVHVTQLMTSHDPTDARLLP